MRRRVFVSLGAVAVTGLFTIGLVAATLAQDEPLDPGLLLDDSMLPAAIPSWQRPAEPGPVIDVSTVEATALQAGGDPNAVVTDTKLVPYEVARQTVKSGNSLSLDPDRQVYLVTLSGDFTFRRHPQGVSDRKAESIYVIVDALTGEVMSRGELSGG